MAQRTCGADECDRSHRARGLCAMHWKRQYGKPTKYPITCIICGANHMSARPDGQFCSDACRGTHASELHATHCDLPADHPVRVLIRQHRRDQREAKRLAALDRKAARLASWRTARECPGCGCWFCPLHTSTTVVCSKRCGKRIERRKRRLSDRHIGWVWSEFMRIAAKFDYCCAYCGTRPARLDPDHVIPLARGGADATTNLLPACQSCNSSKRDLLLLEWDAWRAARGLAPRTTMWNSDDQRYAHLTHAVLAA